MEGHITARSVLAAAAWDILHSDMGSLWGIAILTLFALCFTDVITTAFILSHGGYEMNPVMIPIVTVPVLHVLLKWFVVMFITVIAAVSERLVPRSGMLILCVIIGWYIMVVGHNTTVLLNYFNAV